MLHGYGSKKESYYYQINFLEKYFTVVAPDFPGFGASEELDEAWSVGDYARWLEEFMSVQKLEHPHVIAHSFGARVALKLFSVSGGLADKLVITGGAGLVKERTAQYRRRVKAYRTVKKFFPRLAEKRFGSAEYRTLSPVMKESYKKIVNEDLSDCASHIENATLLIYGAEDTVTPAGEEGEIFHRLIRGSRLERMAGGHFCFCEYPAAFNEKVLQFFTE